MVAYRDCVAIDRSKAGMRIAVNKKMSRSEYLASVATNGQCACRGLVFQRRIVDGTGVKTWRAWGLSFCACAVCFPRFFGYGEALNGKVPEVPNITEDVEWGDKPPCFLRDEG